MFATSHRFWIFMLSFSLISRYFLIYIFHMYQYRSVIQHILIYTCLTPFHLVKYNFVFFIHQGPCLGNKFMCINFQVKPKSDMIGYLSFSFFITSSCVIISRSFYSVANITVSFFSMAHIELCTWTTSSWCIPLLMDIFVASKCCLW